MSNKEDSNYWKKTIMSIDNRKILEYIQDLCRARLDVGRADAKVEEPVKKTKKGEFPYYNDNMTVKLKPMHIPEEEENMDKV